LFAGKASLGPGLRGRVFPFRLASANTAQSEKLIVIFDEVAVIAGGLEGRAGALLG
jgi:hypothetical protein